MRLSTLFTIPKEITGSEELVVLPRKDFEKILKGGFITEDDVLRWSKEAKILKKQGKLTLLKSLKDLR